MLYFPHRLRCVMSFPYGSSMLSPWDWRYLGHKIQYTFVGSQFGKITCCALR